jgi:hypothetical protein
MPNGVEANRGVVHVFETATGEELCTFTGHRGTIDALTFSPDGRRLATGGSDTTVLVWELFAREAPRSVPLSRDDRDALWADLAALDGAAALKAMRTLSAQPGEAVNVLEQRLSPAGDAAMVKRWLAELDHDQFEKREAASAGLAHLGRTAEPVMRAALRDNPKPEAKRRLLELLARIDSFPTPPEQVRVLRAIAVLEDVATPEARKVLDRLASGAPGALVTEDAKAARDRLQRLDALRK